MSELQPLDPRLTDTAAFTPEARTLFLSAIAAGQDRAEAATSADIPWAVLHRVFILDPAFKDEVEILEERRWQIVESALLQAVQEREPWAIKEALRRAPGLRERFQEPTPPPQELTQTAEIGPGLERILTLQANLQARAAELTELSAPKRVDVIDVTPEPSEED